MRMLDSKQSLYPRHAAQPWSTMATLQERTADMVAVTCSGAAAEILILEATPTGDEVCWHGPFVAASKAELRAMFERYQDGTMCARWPWSKNIVTHGVEPRFNDIGDGHRDTRDAISPAAT